MSQSATPATQNDRTTCVETFKKPRFCSFPHRHGINDATTGGEQGSPRPPDYKREPFATHSGKNFSFYQSLPLKTSKYVEPMSSMPFQLLPSLQSRLPPAWPQKIQKTGAPLGTKHRARAKMAVKPSPLLNVISRHSPIPRYFLRKS